jgi:hypothetical protein
MPMETTEFADLQELLPSDGLEPSTPSLPWNGSGNWSQPRATVFAYLSRFRGRSICHGLPWVAPAGLHKGSILCCLGWLRSAGEARGWSGDFAAETATSHSSRAGLDLGGAYAPTIDLVGLLRQASATMTATSRAIPKRIAGWKKTTKYTSEAAAAATASGRHHSASAQSAAPARTKRRRRMTRDGGTQALPELVRAYLARSLPSDLSVPAIVRVQQAGEMWKKPGAGAMAFQATDEFAVERVAFSWRARFPIVGPLAMTVVDEFADGVGQLRVSLLGIPLQTQKGPETSIGEAMRYLAELAWAPQAIAANHQLEWQEVDERTVDVGCDVVDEKAAVRWDFDAQGDLVRATGMRPFPVGKSFERRRWGGDFGEYTDFGGTRVPAFGEAWWELPEGRFVYWRGRITMLELVGDR